MWRQRMARPVISGLALVATLGLMAPLPLDAQGAGAIRAGTWAGEGASGNTRTSDATFEAESPDNASVNRPGLVTKAHSRRGERRPPQRHIVAALTALRATVPSMVRTTEPEFIRHWLSPSNTIIVQTEAGGLSRQWRLLSVVHAWDRAHDLNVRVGTCKRHPAAHCVKVMEYRNRDSNVLGYAVIVLHTDEAVRVHLNAAYPRNQAVTCHEFGHAVGFTHDARKGCTRQPGRTTPSQWELRTSSGQYAS